MTKSPPNYAYTPISMSANSTSLVASVSGGLADAKQNNTKQNVLNKNAMAGGKTHKKRKRGGGCPTANGASLIVPTFASSNNKNIGPSPHKNLQKAMQLALQENANNKSNEGVENWSGGGTTALGAFVENLNNMSTKENKKGGAKKNKTSNKRCCTNRCGCKRTCKCMCGKTRRRRRKYRKSRKRKCRRSKKRRSKRRRSKRRRR